MNVAHYYWFFDSVLPPKFCDDLIKYGNEKQEALALTGDYSSKVNNGEPLKEEEIKNLKKKRDSHVVWLEEPWIYKVIHPFIHAANKNAGWNFDWDFSESCQFTKYKLNQYYGWHCDGWNKPYSDTEKNKNKIGKIRKLSVTCQLTDGADYKGGELEFQYRDNDDPTKTVECSQAKKRGTVIVFPSFVWHRVKPVTEGTRYSLVLWNLGAPFK